MGKEDTSLIGYCSLYCGDCFNYKGEIADLARDLRKKLREAKFEVASRGLAKYFKDFTNYEQCYQVLGAMVRLRCKRACRNGGGNPSCKVRNCCQKKAIDGCWECAESEICTKLDFLTPIHGDAIHKNMKVIEKQGVEAFLKGKRYF